MIETEGGSASVPIITPTTPYLIEIVSQLWPEATVTTRRRLSRAPSPTLGGASFFALPRASSPAMLVPAESRRVTSTALRGAKTGSTAVRRRMLRVLSEAARYGLMGVFAERVSVESRGTGSDDSMVGWLSDRLGAPVRISMSSSPPRANRKPVLHVIGESGETVAFAKVGHNPLTRRLVRSEAEALSHLGTTPSPGVRVPALLLHDRWRGMEVLVLEALVPRGWQSEVGPELAGIMTTFARRGGVDTTDFSSSDYVDRLRRRIGGVVEQPELGESFADDLDDIVRRSDSMPLGLGEWHGDFTPWNLARDVDGLMVWDWERFERGVPLGFDALHYSFQDDVARRGIPPRRAVEALFRRSPSVLDPYGVPAEAADLTTALYLLDIGVRYSTDGQRRLRAPLSRVEEWLVPALSERRTSRTGGR